MTDKYDIAVIGAGIAGIIAARDLSVKGHSVVLFEARDRVGGRTYTGDAFGGQVELGGAYVHWTQPNVWYELQRHNMAVLQPPLDASKIYWLADGTVHSGTEADWFGVVGPALERLFADARTRFPMPFDVNAVDNSAIEKESIEDRISSLGLSVIERDALEGALSGLIHSYKKHGISQLLHGVATYFGDFRGLFETAGFWCIPGGTKRLIDAILAESTAELRLSTPISSIADNGSRVTVTTRSGEKIYASAAIVALPLNTVGDLTITPDVPPAVRAMINQGNPVMAHKIWARVKGHIEPFSALAPAGKHPIPVARTESRLDGDTLVMCICSDAAAIRAEDREAVQAALRTFVPDIEVVDVASHDWVSDEFSKGGWMMHRPGSLTNAAPQMRQPHGRVHFAGSDIAGLDVGAIEGAMGTGAVAAREVAATLATSRYRSSRSSA